MPDPLDPRIAGNVPDVSDAGHTRAREISAARKAAQSRGDPAAGSAARTPDEAPSRTAGGADTDRLRRRARFLRERNEAKELRERVQPRRARSARMRHALFMRTFRW